MTATQQNIDALSKRVAAAIRAALPQPRGQTPQAQIDLWMEREGFFASMYADVAKFHDFLLRETRDPSKRSWCDVAYNPPDVLRAELLANGDGLALCRAIEAATSAQCTKLTKLITSHVLKGLDDAGLVGTVETFGNGVRRLTLCRHDGAMFVCDLTAVQSSSDPQACIRFDRGLLKSCPKWLWPELAVITGRCVRLSDDQQRLLERPAGTVSVLSLGPYVLGCSRRIVPRAPRAGFSWPRLPSLATVASALAMLCVMASLVIGVTRHSTLYTVAGALGLVVAVVWFLLRSSNRARTA